MSTAPGSFQRGISGIRRDGKNPRGQEAQRSCAGVAGNAGRRPKKQTVGHAVRRCVYTTTRPLTSRRGFAQGIAVRNERVGGNAGQGFSHRASAIDSHHPPFFFLLWAVSYQNPLTFGLLESGGCPRSQPESSEINHRGHNRAPGWRKEEQPKVGPKGEGAEATESKSTDDE